MNDLTTTMPLENGMKIAAYQPEWRRRIIRRKFWPSSKPTSQWALAFDLFYSSDNGLQLGLAVEKGGDELVTCLKKEWSGWRKEEGERRNQEQCKRQWFELSQQQIKYAINC